MIDPKRIGAYTGQAAIWRKKNDFDKAIAAYDRAIAADQNQPASYRLRAEAYAAKGDRKRALADFDRALKLSWSVTLLKARAALRLADGDFEGALSDAEAMLKLAPGNADAVALRESITAQQKKDIAAREAPAATQPKPRSRPRQPAPSPSRNPRPNLRPSRSPRPRQKRKLSRLRWSPKSPRRRLPHLRWMPESLHPSRRRRSSRLRRSRRLPHLRSEPKVAAPKITDRLPAPMLDTKVAAPKPDTKVAEPKKPQSCQADKPRPLRKPTCRRPNRPRLWNQSVPLPPVREKSAGRPATRTIGTRRIKAAKPPNGTAITRAHGAGASPAPARRGTPLKAPGLHRSAAHALLPSRRL